MSAAPTPALPGTEPALPAPVFVDLTGLGNGGDDVVRVATYVLEPTDRPPAGDVVLCHGTPWSAWVWAPVARS